MRSLLLVGILSVSAAAQTAATGPRRVDPEGLRRRNAEVQEAGSSPAVDAAAARDKAAGFFDILQRSTPFARPAERHMDREIVDGRMGTMKGFVDTAQQRFDYYKLHTNDVPPAEIEETVAHARKLNDEGRADFDRTGTMADNQMGVFRYVRTEWQGLVKLNAHLAMIATRIGEAFAYATLVHEAGHSRAREEGRLHPEKVIDGELEAYRIQYRWIKIIDPSAERMIVLHSTLRLRLKAHPEDRVTAAAVGYLEHLLQVYDTNGEEPKLRELIDRLGYEENQGASSPTSPTRA
jgi:hypothetical protein